MKGIPKEALFAASMAVAPRAVTGLRNHGQLAPGMAADIVTLDYGAMSGDVIDGMLDASDLVLARGTARHVSSLIVAGREVVRDGEVHRRRYQRHRSRAGRADFGAKGQAYGPEAYRWDLSGGAAILLSVATAHVRMPNQGRQGLMSGCTMVLEPGHVLLPSRIGVKNVVLPPKAFSPDGDRSMMTRVSELHENSIVVTGTPVRVRRPDDRRPRT